PATMTPDAATTPVTPPHRRRPPTPPPRPRHHPRHHRPPHRRLPMTGTGTRTRTRRRNALPRGGSAVGSERPGTCPGIRGSTGADRCPSRHGALLGPTHAFGYVLEHTDAGERR